MSGPGKEFFHALVGVSGVEVSGIVAIFATFEAPVERSYKIFLMGSELHGAELHGGRIRLGVVGGRVGG